MSNYWIDLPVLKSLDEGWFSNSFEKCWKLGKHLFKLSLQSALSFSHAVPQVPPPPPLHPFLIFSTSFLASTGVVLHRKIPYYMGSTHLGSNPTYFRYNQCQRKPSTNRSTLIFAAAAIYGEYTFPSHILYLIFRAVRVNPSVAINKRSQWKLSRVYFLKVARIDIYIWGQKNVQVYGIYCK